MEWVIRGIGLFYIASGALLVRAMALDAMASQLEQVVYGQQTKDRIRHYWLRIGAALTVASGLAMCVLGPLAVPLLIANCVAQGGWLLYARTHFPPEDEIDAQGRRQTTNAFFVLLVVTALTIWAFWSGAVTLYGGEVRATWAMAANWLPAIGGVAVFIAMLVA